MPRVAALGLALTQAGHQRRRTQSWEHAPSAAGSRDPGWSPVTCLFGNEVVQKARWAFLRFVSVLGVRPRPPAGQAGLSPKPHPQPWILIAEDDRAPGSNLRPALEQARQARESDAGLRGPWAPS